MASGKVGAVMVVGGGIAGIQASLDLADSGFRVYLVERSSAIGGRMAQLDKTFPTNDCSMCIMSPKVVQAGRHRNIDILTDTDVTGLSGGPGDFSVSLRRRARYVDLDKCTGCGDCVQHCPVSIPSSFDEGLCDARAIHRLYPQAVPGAFAIAKRGTAPCRVACPAHMSVQGYLALTAERRFAEALLLMKRDNPFPAVCGRICTHPCEGECSRGDVDQPVAIMAVKRFLAEMEPTLAIEPPKPAEHYPERVAVVGAGPGGLTAAYYLATRGYRVTVFEGAELAGGMLRYGVPRYRLPADVLEAEISFIERTGVEIRYRQRLGRDFTLESLRRDGYSSLILATGAPIERRLGIGGEDAEGVVHGIQFLWGVACGEPGQLGRRVAVVGGGNSAIDAVRTARRLGAEEAFVLYRRGMGEMPAHEDEVREAEEEGVVFHFQVAPVRILVTDGKVEGIECVRMELAEPDESGRHRPVPVPGSEFVVEADQVIVSIGQRPETESLDPGLAAQLERGGRIRADDVTSETGEPGIFAVGDCVTGPATVVEAIGAGREAAESAHRYMRGIDLAEGRGQVLEPVCLEGDRECAPAERYTARTLAAAERACTFDEVYGTMGEEEAVAEAKRCLACGICSECYQCEEHCEADAILHDQRDEELSVRVGSIVLAPGFAQFDATRKPEYGYGRHRNVVTALEMERILSASGPFAGHLVRPGDGREPRSIAFVQCVGSRDARANEYCSGVCCMHAIKEAVIAKEHATCDLDTEIFFMDIRAFGKEFDAYYARAEREHGVKFTRARPAHIAEDPGTGNLIIDYVEAGERREKEFEMVVLSTALEIDGSARELADSMGVELTGEGFCKTGGFEPLDTTRPGVFVCGAFQSPKDIPDSVAQASGAAARASSVIADARGQLVEEEVYPEERDVLYERPRIGVFVCNCGINIGGVVDVPAVAEYARTLPNVVYAEDNLYTCSQDTQERMKGVIGEHMLNRVVVASCTPRTHEALFQNTTRQAGLNRHLFEMTNIRDQCSWVHMHAPGQATEKAKDLVRMAVAKAQRLRPLRSSYIDVIKRGLVIGGGIAGMTAALELARQGFDVTLLERGSRLGGNALRVTRTSDGQDPRVRVEELAREIEGSERVSVHVNAEIESIAGYVGRFTTAFNSGGERGEVEHGIVVVATGAVEHEPTEYMYGHARVTTQLELEERLDSGALGVGEIVMVQCVGARDEEHPNCSRICCTTAIKNAIRIKRSEPGVGVTILYKDIRTYGLRERLYREAAELGVRFMRYDDATRPEVEDAGGGLVVRVRDHVLGEEVELRPDVLVLSAANRPNPGNEELAQLLKVPLNSDGYFLEAHMKLRPVDFATEGVYVCGAAHSPKFMDECISQAYAATSRAATVLSKDKLLAEATISVVDEERCSGCEACISVCPYNAIERVSEKAHVIEALCKGCGACAGACRNGAIQQRGFRDEQIIDMIDAALEEVE